MNFKISSAIKKIENYKINPLFLGLYIFFVILIREFLDSISSHSNLLSPSLIFIQYPLWFISLFLVFVLIVHAFTKERVTSIFKIASFFLPIIWLVPIIDLIVTNGAMTGFIQITSTQDIFQKIILWTQHSPINSVGISWGIIIELTLVFVMLLSYVYIKSRSIVKSISALIISYLAAFIFGSPSLISALLKLVNSSWVNLNSFLSAYSIDTIVSLSLLLFLSVILPIFFYKYDKEKFSSFFRYISATRIVHYLVLLNSGIGLAVILNLISIKFSFLEVLIIILANFSVAFSWIFAKFINDYFDTKEDSVSNKGNPFISKKFSRTELGLIYFSILSLSLLISCLISYNFFFLNLITIGISFIYSCPPLRLKRIFLLSHLCIALASGFVFLSGISLASNIFSLSGLELKFFILIIFIFLIDSQLKDIKDYEGDKKAGISTLPVLLGEKRAKLIMSIMISLLFIFITLFLNLIYLLPFSIVCGIAIFYFLNRKNYKEIYIFLIHLMFFLVSVIFLIKNLIVQA